MSKQGSGLGIGCAIAAAFILVPSVFVAGWVLSGVAVVHRAASDAQQRQLEAVQQKADPAKQKQRAELIGKLTAQGAFSKVEVRDGGLVRLWTGPQFDALQFDTKKAFVSVVYAYCFDGQDSDAVVVIHDGRTGKQIGTFTRYGLTMN